MVCCILIFGLISLALLPLRWLGLLKTSNSGSSAPLAWIPEQNNLKLSGSRFSWADRVKSFSYALSGLRHVLQEEHNARIHLAVAALVLIGAIFLGVSSQEMTSLVLVIMAVGFAETMNTAFEHLCDVVSPQKNASVKFAKDIAAGAVLICAIGAVIVGVNIFAPYIGGILSHSHHS